MPNLFCCLLADQPPGPPLIGSNFVFYAVFGCVLLLFLLPLVLWLRRRPNKTESKP